MKSVDELDRFINDIVLAEEFNLSDLRGFRAAKELHQLQLNGHTEWPKFSSKDGWIETLVKILLSAERNRNVLESDAPQFEVKGLFYQPLIKVIKSVFQEACYNIYSSPHILPISVHYLIIVDSVLHLSSPRTPRLAMVEPLSLLSLDTPSPRPAPVCSPLMVSHFPMDMPGCMWPHGTHITISL